MKGVILCGGKGTRLLPATRVTNKHMLPIFDGKVYKPMAQHCVEKLTEAGITDILIVTGGEHIGGIAEFFGGGKEFGCQFTYKVQAEAGGIAQALSLAEGFVRDGEDMCVILGDNIFEDSLQSSVKWFDNQTSRAAMVILKEVPDPGRYGVAEVEDNTIVGIEEKPKVPKSSWAVTGVYFYTAGVFDIISTLKPSGRGELEITDVNNYYVRNGEMACRFFKGWWTDAGTHESYRLANELVCQLATKQS